MIAINMESLFDHITTFKKAPLAILESVRKYTSFFLVDD